MLIKSRGKYEDIGGRVDKQDKTIYDTVLREANEETNGVLNNISIFDRIKDSNYIYNAKSKYALFIIEATDAECKLESEIFGDKEISKSNNIGCHYQTACFLAAIVEPRVFCNFNCRGSLLRIYREHLLD